MRNCPVTREYQICNRCVLDTTAPKIQFDEDGNCNYCTRFLDKISAIGDKKEKDVDLLIDKIKESGKGKKYDCVLGLSGGLDSTWALKIIVEKGLTPLVVHMDNGWNSEAAQNNIHNIVERLNVDLYTHVIDWEEYKDMMQAFFDADVLDIELLMDHAFVGALYKQANKYNIKYILTGQNNSNEGMGMPEGWNWYKLDKKNILSIWKKYGKLKKLKTYPFFGTFDWIVSQFIRKVEWVRFLDYFEFNDKEALDILVREYGYKAYEYKHYESIFTRFYQGYILPNKFKFDKRRLHLSNTILTGQITRNDALSILEQPPYPDQDRLDEDIEYIIKKMGWDKKFLSEYLKRPEVSHRVYGTERDILKWPVKIKHFWERK